MENQPKTIQKPKANYRVQRQKQTGFSSPATHYSEPTIDLNAALVNHHHATFFVRAVDDRFGDFDIKKNDVLIVDKSLTPQNNQLLMANANGEFIIKRMNDEENLGQLDVWGVITYIIKSVL